MHNIGKKIMNEFWEKAKKVHFWALFAQIWANENFPEKSGSVTFVHLWISNFMQNIRKNKWTNSKKNALLVTDGRTWVYRTLRPPDGGPKMRSFNIIYFIWIR